MAILPRMAQILQNCHKGGYMYDNVTGKVVNIWNCRDSASLHLSVCLM